MRKSLITLTIICLLLGGFLVGCGKPASRSNVVSVSTTSTPTISTTLTLPISKIFIDPQVFRSTDRLQPFNFKGKPIAGVVNHHILAADLVARFLKTLRAVRPDIETFVILSPDHFSQGRGISTHELTYVTAAGDVAVNKLWLSELKKDGVWDGTDSRAFENEHGVGALAPFVAREFPSAKILPIFLRADLKLDQAQELGRLLAKLADDKTFIVVSSDMSHYLKESDARQHDVETIKWLQQKDWSQLEAATDKNTDSAVGFTVLQSYLQTTPSPRPPKLTLGVAGGIKGGKGDFTLLSHKLSTDYVADTKNTTSYIVGFWE